MNALVAGEYLLSCSKKVVDHRRKMEHLEERLRCSRGPRTKMHPRFKILQLPLRDWYQLIHQTETVVKASRLKEGQLLWVKKTHSSECLAATNQELQGNVVVKVLGRHMVQPSFSSSYQCFPTIHVLQDAEATSNVVLLQKTGRKKTNLNQSTSR